MRDLIIIDLKAIQQANCIGIGGHKLLSLRFGIALNVVTGSGVVIRKRIYSPVFVLDLVLQFMSPPVVIVSRIAHTNRDMFDSNYILYTSRLLAF